MTNEAANDADTNDREGEPVLHIGTMEAVGMLEPFLGGGLAAKRELADRLRDGRLKAHAAEVWLSAEPDVLVSWQEELDLDDPAYDYRTNIDVAVGVWRKSVQWDLDQASWRWPRGRFSVVHRTGNDFLRFMIDGVRFYRGAIEQIRDLFDGKPPANGALPAIEVSSDDGWEGNEKPFKSTRHTRAKENAFLVLELLRLYENGELAQPKYRAKDALTEHLVVLALTKKTMGSDTLERKN